MHLIKKCFAFLLITASLLFANNKSFGQLSKGGFNPDSSQTISLTEFNNRVERAIKLLQTETLSAISDTDHINIMMCLNTVFMTHKRGTFVKRFSGNMYEQLEMIAHKKNYDRDITNVYPDYIPNRGMGYYFPKLKMELYGTPRLYAIFRVSE
jgi:hypothetical protein